jgi:hypothetical protein
MSKTVPAIRGVKARAVVVPLKRPVKNAFGVFTSGPLVQRIDVILCLVARSNVSVPDRTQLVPIPTGNPDAVLRW